MQLGIPIPTVRVLCWDNSQKSAPLYKKVFLFFFWGGGDHGKQMYTPRLELRTGISGTDTNTDTETDADADTRDPINIQ